jgi:hypothetical protein
VVELVRHCERGYWQSQVPVRPAEGLALVVEMEVSATGRAAEYLDVEEL